jgi:hypothetical protein
LFLERKMSDVQVNVIVDGKTVFVHGASGTPDATSCALFGLHAAVSHFEAVKAVSVPQPPPNLLYPAASLLAQQAVNAGTQPAGSQSPPKGPSL